MPLALTREGGAVLGAHGPVNSRLAMTVRVTGGVSSIGIAARSSADNAAVHVRRCAALRGLAILSCS